MNRHRPNVIFMCLKFFNLFRGVVIVNSNKFVIRSTNKPVLARYELCCPDCKHTLKHNFSSCQLKLITKKIEKKNVYSLENICHVPGDSVTLKDFSRDWKRVKQTYLGVENSRNLYHLKISSPIILVLLPENGSSRYAQFLNTNLPGSCSKLSWDKF